MFSDERLGIMDSVLWIKENERHLLSPLWPFQIRLVRGGRADGGFKAIGRNGDHFGGNGIVGKRDGQGS